MIAYGRGGALETVIDAHNPTGRSPTGLFFYEQSAFSIKNAVIDFENIYEKFNLLAIHEHAQTFSIQSFKDAFQHEINKALTEIGSDGSPVIEK